MVDFLWRTVSLQEGKLSVLPPKVKHGFRHGFLGHRFPPLAIHPIPRWPPVAMHASVLRMVKWQSFLACLWRYDRHRQGFFGVFCSFDKKHNKRKRNCELGGGNSNIFLISPLFGEDEPNLTHIFQMGGKKPPTSELVNKYIQKQYTCSRC